MSLQQPNNAGSSNWLATIPGLEEVSFKLKTCPIPGFSVMPTEMPTGTPYIVSDVGDKADFEELGLEFYVDVNFKNYRKAFRWIMDDLKKGSASRRDITVELLDNQKNPQGLAVVFFDAYPYAMTQIDTDTNGDFPDLTVMLQLRYTHFDFVDSPCEDC